MSWTIISLLPIFVVNLFWRDRISYRHSQKPATTGMGSREDAIFYHWQLIKNVSGAGLGQSIISPCHSGLLLIVCLLIVRLKLRRRS